MRELTVDELEEILQSELRQVGVRTLARRIWEAMNVEPQVAKAIRIAKLAHDQQLDKAGEPYFFHVEWVGSTFVMPEDEALTVAGYLHDVVKDTDWTLENLREEGVSEEALEIVDALTQRSGESRVDYLLRIAAHPGALRVKLAGIAHNLRPSRLNELDQETVERLIRKYSSSLQVLAQGAAG